MFLNKINIAIATLFAVALAGCSLGGSTEETCDLGGSSEEPGIQALLPNVFVSGSAKLIARNVESSEVVDSSAMGTWSISAKKGTIIRMAELDSVTLDTTGVFYYAKCQGYNGEFSFDSVSLNSPYVMLEIAPYVEDGYWKWDGTWSFDEYNENWGEYTITYSAIVDVRDSGGVDINIMTYLETARLRYLVRQGMDFAAAKQQADREILESLGLPDGVFSFDDGSYLKKPKYETAMLYMNAFIICWLRKSSPLIIADAFGTSGTLTSVDSIRDYFAASAYSFRTGMSAGYGNSAFLDGFLATLYGLGKCTPELEGHTEELPCESRLFKDITCVSGAWTILDKNTPEQLEEAFSITKGTMTDARDGKVYKTVTYSFEGSTYTWLAENLRYSDSLIQPVLGIDSAFFVKNQGRDGEFEEYINSRDSSYWETYAGYAVSDVIGGDSIVMENGRFQGLCPDGWHIPTRKEWSRVFYFAEKESGECYSHDCREQFEVYEGFGWYASRYLHQIGFGDITMEYMTFLQQDEAGSWSVWSFTMDNWKPYDYRVSDDPDVRISIRCVKN
ncbi:FISUMP domain-containing protein [Fibrobacter sp. UWB13]|uniref:FISUMP domain-containing protein n=1 Tax=Fibrobacter sp. UWB13 TaxID=1896204 RepID=UPI000A0C81DB|nr:FISUMP domain-containing protein [Fibrobacter sp. UWB13]SMG25338.1 major paralogous domain-containing protein [Fibrobacter sp. UWB13]